MHAQQRDQSILFLSLAVRYVPMERGLKKPEGSLCEGWNGGPAAALLALRGHPTKTQGKASVSLVGGPTSGFATHSRTGASPAAYQP